MDNLPEQKRNRILEQLERRLDQLPLLPGAVAHIVTLDPGESGFAGKVEALTRADPPLAFRLIHLANAALLESSPPILTLEQAIARIGARRLAETITTLSVMEVFVPSTPQQKDLWIHSLQVAGVARRISEVQGERSISPLEAYLAGLLHDIGRFVLFDQSPKELGQVDETGWVTGIDILKAETDICGLDHAELGWEACRKWSLPERISLLIKNHHIYETGGESTVPPELGPLVRTVQEADLVSFALLSEPDIVARPVRERTARLGRFLGVPKWTSEHFLAPQMAEDLPALDLESRILARSLMLLP